MEITKAPDAQDALDDVMEFLDLMAKISEFSDEPVARLINKLATQSMRETQAVFDYLGR